MEPDNYTVLIFYETLELHLIGNRRNVIKKQCEYEFIP